MDLSIARNIRLGGGRSIQLRVDMFNAFNRAGITGRNTTLQLTNPSDPITNNAPVFDPITGLLNDGVNLTSTGAVSTERSKPKNAGFGVANIRKGGQAVQKRGDNSLAAMNLELSAILAGEAMRGREE